MAKLTAVQRLECEVAGIREGLTDLLTNHMPHLKVRLGNVEDRGKFNTQLILGVYGVIAAGAIAVIVTVLVK